MRFKFPFQFRTKYKIAQRGIQTEAQRLDQILSSSYSPSFVYKSKFTHKKSYLLSGFKIYI